MKSVWLALTAVILLLDSAANARTFIVSNSADDTSPASLRGAIMAANARGGENIIVLQTNVQLNLGTLVVTEGRLTIRSKHSASIDASSFQAGALAIFCILPSTQVKMENLVIMGGGGSGGGINNAGDLHLRSCTVSNNFSFMGGGGVLNSGNLLMENCRVQGNVTASGRNPFSAWVFTGVAQGLNGSDGVSGGGVFNSGTMILLNTLISDNTCGSGGVGADGYGIGGSGGNGGHGAGIYNAGIMLLYRCVVENNTAGDGGGGGIGLPGPYGPPYNPQNFPIACGDGGKGGNGGGICNAADASSAILIHSSVTSNSSGVGGPSGGDGGVDGADGLGADIFGDVTFSNRR